MYVEPELLPSPESVLNLKPLDKKSTSLPVLSALAELAYSVSSSGFPKIPLLLSCILQPAPLALDCFNKIQAGLNPV